MVSRLEDVVHVPHRLVMGLSAVVDEREWLVIDDDLCADLRLKDRLLREKREQVFVELPGSEAAQREARDTVVRHLESYHAHRYSWAPDRIQPRPDAPEVALDDARPALETAARLVQEDLCVLERQGADWLLTAAAVCFPTRWDLPSKLGLTLADIHARVPGYAGPLSDSTDRFFSQMKQGRVFQRGNWSLMDDPALFQPQGKFRERVNARITSRNAGERVWLRREHQTLQRLPATGAALFGVRVLCEPLERAARDATLAARLADGIRTMPIAMQRYKSLPTLREAVLGYLDAIVAAG